MSAKSGSLSIVCVPLGPQKMSVVQSSGVSAIQGLLKYRSQRKDSRDFRDFPLYCRCPLLRGVHKQGSTVCKLPATATSWKKSSNPLLAVLKLQI